MNLNLQDAPRTLVANLTGKENLLLLHLLNYEDQKEIKTVHDVGVNLHIPSDKGVKQVFALSPDFAERTELKHELLQTDQNKEVKFTLPEMKIYALVVIEFVGYRGRMEKWEDESIRGSKKPTEETPRQQEEKVLRDYLVDTI